MEKNKDILTLDNNSDVIRALVTDVHILDKDKYNSFDCEIVYGLINVNCCEKNKYLFMV